MKRDRRAGRDRCDGIVTEETTPSKKKITRKYTRSRRYRDKHDDVVTGETPSKRQDINSDSERGELAGCGDLCLYG